MKILNKIIPTIFLITFALIFTAKEGFNGNMVLADTVLKSGISLVDRVPDGLFGTWRVRAVLKETDSRDIFRSNTVDLWNLSRNNDVMNLNNPFTGATANLSVHQVKNGTIKFSKDGITDNKKLTDTVEIKLNGNSFTGINTLTLRTLSDVDDSVIKTQHAVYTLSGEKISGMSILEK